MTPRKQQSERDGGFTLVELLVIIVIVGVLAGIAIPIFLHQKGKAADATARSDLRNLAVAEESYATDNISAYGTATELAAAGQRLPVSAEDTVYVYTSGPAGYCMVGHSNNSDVYLVYDSQHGGMQAPEASLAAAQGVCADAGYSPGGAVVHDSSGLHVS
ncbi:MAG: type pilus assembly protein PilA [Frankiaceae bacterium]|nr:type pilus assembly protein PilA [Frankiaceae bacterium]